MYLNFSSDKYKKLLLNHKCNYNNDISSSDMFLILIKDVEYHDLDNLCLYVRNYFIENGYGEHSLNEVYDILMGNSNIIDISKIKNDLLNIAYMVLDMCGYLGSNVINNTNINTSSWLSHSLYESICCSRIADMLEVDSDIARKLGLIHDIGRKKINNFKHVILGSEYLIDNGYLDEAYACIKHSFLGHIDSKIYGLRCSCLETELENYKVLDNYKYDYSNVLCDDVMLILNKSEYNIYDLILNVSDLMSMSSGVTSLKERIEDILKRKSISHDNLILFYKELTGILSNFLMKMGVTMCYSLSDKEDVIINNFIYLNKLFYSYYLIQTEENC